ncbi:MAG: type II toxin-antitoxin system VapC family toxin [Spirochaetota bacterium]
MKCIIDTHVLLWALSDPERLSSSSRALIVDPTNSILVSAMSLAEIAIKASTGKLAIDESLEARHYEGMLKYIEASGFEVLPYHAADAVLLRELDFHHRDPFDRMIITQAIRLKCPIMTTGSFFSLYPVRVIQAQ